VALSALQKGRRTEGGNTAHDCPNRVRVGAKQAKGECATNAIDGPSVKIQLKRDTTY